jgi:lysozyme
VSDKRLFDTIRRLLGRPLRQSEVDAINASMRPDAPSLPELPITPETIGEAGLALIQEFEGCHRKLPNGLVAAYPDPGTGGEPWTIGWGATRDGLHGYVQATTIWTQKQCDERLEADLVKYADDVKAALGSALPATSQSQFDALVSFHYNTGAIARATLTRLHKAGLYLEAAAEFARWNRAGGRVLRGLVRRREAEADLYRKGSK